MASPLVPSDHLVQLREILPLLRQFGGLLGSAPVLHVVLDTNVIRDEIGFHFRKLEKEGVRSALNELVASGTVLLFAPEQARLEVDRHLARWTDEWRQPSTVVQETWKAVQQRITFVSTESLPIPAADDVKALMERDPDDVAFIVARELVGAAAVVTHDNDLLDETSRRTARVSLLLDLRKFAREKALELQLRVSGHTVLVFSAATLLATGYGLFLLIKLVRQAPPWMQLTLAGIAVAAVVHPRSRARIVDTVRDLAKTAGSAATEALPHVERFIAEASKAEARSDAAWAKVQEGIPGQVPITLQQAMYAACLASREPLSLSRLIEHARNAGCRLERDGAALVRAALQGDERFVAVGVDSWTARTEQS